MMQLVACGLVYPIREGEETVRQPSQGEGGAEVDEAGNVIEAGSADAMLPPDAEIDASVAASPCDPTAPAATATTFCMDFDREQFITDHWDSFYTEVMDAAVPSFDSTFFKSPARSGMITLSPGTNVPCGSAQLRKAFEADTVKQHVDLWLRDDMADGAPTGAEAGIAFSLLLGGTKNTTHSCALGFVISQDAQIGEQDFQTGGATPFYSHSFHQGLVRGTWYHVVWDIDRTTSPAMMDLSVNGEPLLTRDPLDSACDGPGYAELRLGPTCFADPPTPIEFRFDNVVFDVTP